MSHVLAAPVLGKLFLLYIRSMEHSLEALLAQHNNQRYKHAIYYMSIIMVGAKHQYNQVEKECLALVFVV